MKGLFSTLAQAVVLVALALGVALAANQVRGANAIKLAEHYFKRPVVPVQAATTVTAEAARATSTPASGAAEPNAPASQNTTEELLEGTPEQPFKIITRDDVKAAWEDPKFQQQLYVIVDARNDKAYEEGHIPGAVQCDYYRFERYLQDVVPAVLGAEKVIVYCNGRDCEDSLLVCGKLVEYQVPWHAIYLYKDGWEDWSKHQMPIAAGRE